MLKKALITIIAIGVSCSAALGEAVGNAPNIATLITPELKNSIVASLDAKIIRLSIASQNARYSAISQSKIDSLDKQWRAERNAADKPLIAATLSNPLSVYLTRMQGRSLGLLAEVFVMDKNGLNVGQSSTTSDFWQGDEAKFQKTFPMGPKAVFVDEPEWDEKFQIWRSQINFTITDDDGKTPIGAATVEVNLTELARRQTANIK